MSRKLQLPMQGGSPDQSWCWVVEPDGGLTRRQHGYAARVRVRDESGASLPVAALLRAAAAVGRALEPSGDRLCVRLGPAGTRAELRERELHVDGAMVAGARSHHLVEATVAETVAELIPPARDHAVTKPDIPWRPNRALFFESLMSSDLPHNDRELSQGVLHMVSTLRGTPTEVVFANVKMPIVGADRPMTGLDSLERALSGERVDLVCITLLEGYFEGVVELCALLRKLGCRAHIAVGGVMPTLTPEHVAAHLPEVSFVCRGAGEYFVPRLARIVGDRDVTVPFDDRQRQALLAMDGLIAIDRAAGELLACNPGRVVEVEALDAVELDLSHLEPRHIEGGIEISTARGCVHHCSFCTIIGRHSYTARSVDGMLAMLRRYQERFAELFGSEVPPNAYRVHISDDDFACDAERAIEFLRRLRETPFRLSSLQVSIADLCVREGRALMPRVDPRFLEVLSPECFADHGKPVPASDYVADHKSRSWSSYLQIGVETFSDAELVRLAKGYRIDHVRAVVAALAERGIHMDAYFIASNSDTRAEELLESMVELVRLKLRHPRHFHLRYPIVPHLVSYFPSQTHKLKQRRGEVHTMKLRRHAHVAGHDELDYPFVDHDIPQDPWVACAVDAGVLDDARYYSAALERLRAVWAAKVATLSEGAERARGERLVRLADDASRRLALERVAEEITGEQKSGTRDDRRLSAAVAVAEGVLGTRDRWLPSLKRFQHQEVPRLVVIPTWQCELRCRYCYIPKQDGRVMSRRTIERSVELLLSSAQPEVLLQYFGGEALMEYELVQHSIEYGSALARERNKHIRFVLSTNGWSLDDDKLRWLGQHPVKLELSLDGDVETQNKFRPALLKGADSYVNGIAPRTAAILASGLPYDVIMVVPPQAAERLADNFFHIASLGYRRIQVNFALGPVWTLDQQRAFARELHAIGNELERRAGAGITMVNLENRPLPIRLNAEITVDWDGTIYGGNAFLHETEHKEKFVMGHLDDLGSFDRYWLDAPSNEHLLAWSYAPDVTQNNLAVGRIMTSFMRWMQKERVTSAWEG